MRFLYYTQAPIHEARFLRRAVSRARGLRGTTLMDVAHQRKAPLAKEETKREPYRSTS